MGKSKTWISWVPDVAQICQNQVEAIAKHLQASPALVQAFNDFKAELYSTVRTTLSDQDVIVLISQLIVVKPVLDVLFKGFPFTEKNPIALAMTNMLGQLDQDGLIKPNQQLQEFYDSVALRMRNVTTLRDRQAVIIELFDSFFKNAFPKQQEKLGIVYTPVEVVDFINHSVNDILKQEFGQSLAAPNVHILDPFAGAGTFITCMMLDEALLPLAALDRKCHYELHANEIMPLAYYVASINVESAFVERTQVPPEQYQPNSITVLTDTFADMRDLNSSAGVISNQTNQDADLACNNQLRDNVDSKPLWVIVGNPPYSSGQGSQNDDNQNSFYPALEKRITETYAKKAGRIKLKNSLYNSYIKAFRWASDKLGEQGVIAFVSNAGWLDSASACGMRRCLQEEFSSIYVYHLKGNQRTTGEQSRKEGGKVFGEDSRAPIAITILVKTIQAKNQAKNQGKIFFGSVDDYLTREAKLEQLTTIGSIYNAALTELTPDAHGDWLSQRRSDFAKFISMDGKHQSGGIFSDFSNGVKTNRDAWSYNASRSVIENSFTRCISFYNSQVDAAARLKDEFERNNDPTKISWTRSIIGKLQSLNHLSDFSPAYLVQSSYRPFFKEWLYNDSSWLEARGQQHNFYPFAERENLSIVLSGISAQSFCCLASNTIVCFDYLEKNQCFPRYVYRKVGAPNPNSSLLDGIQEQQANTSAKTSKVEINGYIREDAIKPEAVEHFREAYPEYAGDIDADSLFYYIYGLLHSEEYRSTYANNLQKELPRIPRVATYEDFVTFEQAGRELAKLHVDYESVETYAGCTIELPDVPDYAVAQMHYGKIAGKKGEAAKDKTVIHYNESITIRNIPLEAQEYVVKKKSALDWIVDRCCVSQDKDSKIVNNYNDYAREVGDAKYIFNLVLRVITVSLESLKIIKALPPLHIHPLDK